MGTLGNQRESAGAEIWNAASVNLDDAIDDAFENGSRFQVARPHVGVPVDPTLFSCERIEDGSGSFANARQRISAFQYIGDSALA